MATTLHGLVDWRLTRDDAGYREYTLTNRVQSDVGDGPYTVLTGTAGLPLPGSAWNVRNDYDPWVWCLPGAEVEQSHGSESRPEPGEWWHVRQKFTNKPLPFSAQRCHDIQIEDPLLEPPKVSGRGLKFTTEAIFDKDGNKILTSSHERIRGPQNEWDDDRPTIRIEQNVATPYLAYVLPYFMANKVNSVAIWGFPLRSLKLSDWSWDIQYWGQCSVYYRRTLEFETARLRTYNGELLHTWDRYVLDEGTKCLQGHWNSSGEWELEAIDGKDPDPDNPSHFKKFVDRDGNATSVILDGGGLPANTTVRDVTDDGDGTGTEITGDPADVFIQYYAEDDFTQLGVPLAF